MLSEAAVGAGLVLFRLVADNASMARALFMAAHLTNTFVLLAALTLTAWWLSGGGAPALRARPRAAGVWAFSAAAFLVASISGAVAALGDTLYPSASLAEGLRADLSATSHLLIRLRAAAPGAGGVGGGAAMLLAPRLARTTTRPASSWRELVIAVAVLQVVAGLTNVLLLAPVWMQIVHLLLADARVDRARPARRADAVNEPRGHLHRHPGGLTGADAESECLPRPRYGSARQEFTVSACSRLAASTRARPCSSSRFTDRRCGAPAACGARRISVPLRLSRRGARRPDGLPRTAYQLEL